MPLIQLPSADTNKVPDKDNLGFDSLPISLRLDFYTLLFVGRILFAHLIRIVMYYFTFSKFSL
jgi:hypothetical protein